MTSKARSVFLFSILISLSFPASAKTKADPALEKAAKKACITGDVARGIDILGDLFVETDDITYVFNQARCFQQNSRWEESIARFEEYLRKSPNLSEASRAEVNGYIAECKAHLSPTMLPPSPPPPAAAVSASPAPASPAGPEPSVTLTSDPLPVRPVPAAASGMRVAAVVSAAVGLVALSTGLILDYTTHRLVDDVKKNGYDPGKLSSRDSYETWGWVGYGAGAAGLATGIVLYVLGSPSEESGVNTAPLSIVPAVGPGTVALVLQGGLR